MNTDTPTPELVTEAREFARRVARERGHDILFDTDLMTRFALQVSARERDAAVKAERLRLAEKLDEIIAGHLSWEVIGGNVASWYQSEFAADIRDGK
jgi:hypothetical protein